ncbi:phage head-tail joining protein [Desulfosporosinus acididurans]|uniref:Phage head-tail joining protein n=1 Tax=Desulfosporosinus acididurans TaxID=476652 RepID=A0A0J1IH83_9FIRM|nr:phage head closure protein [Desulfosporosinus acididurans]KLU64021.1 phage head-tail joining protein [Desulfosporosinus acididurans]
MGVRTPGFNLGSLNKRITLLTWVESTNEAQETILVPSIFTTVWASVSPVRGRDYMEAKKYQAELTYKITIRYLAGVTPDMQIQFKDRTFLIQDIINPFEHNELLEIMAIERIAKNG